MLGCLVEEVEVGEEVLGFEEVGFGGGDVFGVEVG